jgi:murein DD-endopeptidase MepM/ murein hydrolase activator NlpD
LRLLAVALPAVLLAACASTVPRPGPQSPGPQAGIGLPQTAPQGALIIGAADPAAEVEVDGRRLRVSPAGRYVFGIGRDAQGSVVVAIRSTGAGAVQQRIAVTPRDWPVERIVGAPPATVNPPPEVAARIAREQAQVDAARARDDARDDYAQRFIWPVQGRISGRFGNQRVYVLPDDSEAPKAPHSGMDIAAPAGTPVLAPAAGVVTFASPDLYLTGGTVLLDHGHGVSSNFLHLSRIDVQVGMRVAQGQVIGAVGATGRATGPHLHWGMNWFDVRVDPLLVLEAAGSGDSGTPPPAGTETPSP